VKEYCPNCWEPMRRIGIRQGKLWFQCGACGTFTTHKVRTKQEGWGLRDHQALVARMGSTTPDLSRVPTPLEVKGV
jgi:uncharacterized Zn finger protein